MTMKILDAQHVASELLTLTVEDNGVWYLKAQEHDSSDVFLLAHGTPGVIWEKLVREHAISKKRGDDLACDRLNRMMRTVEKTTV